MPGLQKSSQSPGSGAVEEEAVGHLRLMRSVAAVAAVAVLRHCSLAAREVVVVDHCRRVGVAEAVVQCWKLVVVVVEEVQYWMMAAAGQVVSSEEVEEEGSQLGPWAAAEEEQQRRHLNRLHFEAVEEEGRPREPGEVAHCVGR